MLDLSNKNKTNMEATQINYNSLTNVEIIQYMNAANESIKIAKLQIKNLQKLCNHHDVSILIINTTLRNVCQSCNRTLDYPSIGEVERAGYIS